MRKIILSVALVALMANFINAQEIDQRPRFHMGIKAGANFANVYDSNGEEFRADGKLGFAGGVFFSIPMGTYFGFQPEVMFAQKGFKATGTLFGTNYGLTRTTNFIDVPLLLAIKPLDILTIFVGPQFSYLMKRTNVFNSELGSVEQVEEFNNENIRKNIFGAVIGVDVNLHPVVFGVRAGWDLSTNNGDGSSQTPRYKNAVVQATVGFRFI